MSTRIGSSCWRRAKTSRRRTRSDPCSARALGHRQDLLALVRQLGAPLDQSEPAKHRGEQIVEIVRDAAGQLADRVHLLRLDELAFERSPLGDVGQRAGELDRTPVARRGEAPPGRGNACSCRRRSASDIRPRNGPVGRAAASAFGRARDHPRGGGRPTASGSAATCLETEAGHRLEIAADELRAARLALERLEIEDDRKRLDDRRLALLGAAQLLLGLQALGIGVRLSHRASACSCRALRSISLVLANRSTNTATFERSTIGSTGLNT